MTPSLLDNDGSPTPVTIFLLVHRALRRDLARFPQAVRLLIADDTVQAGRIVDYWRRVRGALDGHHAAEDERLFPALLAAEPALADVMAVLDGQHAALDGALATIESALAELPGPAAPRAAELLAAFADDLDGHLALEEEHLVPVMLRTAGGIAGPGRGSDPEPAARPDGASPNGPGARPPRDGGASGSDVGHDGGAGATQGWLLAWGAEGLDRQTLDAVLGALPPAVAERAPALLREHVAMVRAVWRDLPDTP